MKKIIVKFKDKYMGYDLSIDVVFFDKNPRNIATFDSFDDASNFMEENRKSKTYTGPYELFEIILP